MTKKLQLTFVFCLYTLLSYSQYIFDGDEGCNEYTDSFQPSNQPSLGASTCDVNEVYGVLYEDDFGVSHIQLGIEHGNKGQSTFRVYLNTDCNASTGQDKAPENFNSKDPNDFIVPVGGADYVVLFNTGQQFYSEVYKWNNTTSSFGLISSVDIQSKLGKTCAGIESFVELVFPVEGSAGLLDPCSISANPCGSVEITSILSNAGNSPSSNYCQDVSLFFNVDVNTPPNATFSESKECYFNDNLDQVVGYVFEPTTSVDPNFGDFPGNNDEVTYVWSSEPECVDCFTNQSGTAVSASDILTYFKPEIVGDYTITLMLSDSFGCSTSGLSVFSTTIEVNQREVDQDLTLCSEYVSLPVNLLSSDLVFEDHEVVYSWSTISEINNNGFSVERSADGHSFETIGWVSGNGTTNDRNDYSFVDSNPFEGTSFYRLVQEDFDGKKEILGLQSIVNTSGNNLSVYPNPIGNLNNVTLEFNSSTDKTINVDLISVNGQRVLSQNLQISKGISRKFLDVSNIQRGVYTLKIVSGNEISTQVLFK